MDYSQLNDLTKKFLVTEGGSEPLSVRNYILALKESLERMNPGTNRDRRNLTLAKDHLKEIRRGVRKLQEQVKILEEQVKILEEGKNLNED